MLVIRMEYISIHEISEKWKMKERKVTAFCREDRIPGAKKVGKTWMIPSDALIPLDKRTKDYEEYQYEVKEEKSTIPYTSVGSNEKVIDYYSKKYNKKPK